MNTEKSLRAASCTCGFLSNCLSLQDSAVLFEHYFASSFRPALRLSKFRMVLNTNM